MRSSGILTPVSALPSRHGIGTLGKEAYNFIDFLSGCGQRYWQILPCGPTGYGDSSYQSFSAHAGNPYWIDLDMLAADGILKRAEITRAGFVENPDRIDYGDLYEKRFPLLKKASYRISPADKDFLSFCSENAEWLDDYALFMSIKSENHMAPLSRWPDKYRVYSEKKTGALKEKFKEETRYWSVLQYLFYRQWDGMKKYANDKGVKIIGDIPIYVAADSSDLWANHELFQVGGNKRMKFVAGCPPDYFDKDGQLWGNPLYDWNYHKQHDYEWWVKRIKHAEKMYDVVRIDHFRGLAGYYSIPAKNETAAGGKWRRGPGESFVSAIKESAPEFTIIAEDLGYLTPAVRKLLTFSGFPGMKVLQFAFSGSEDNEYLPHKHIKNSVVYTGTHDNMTTAEWAETIPPHEAEFARKYLKIRKNANLTKAMVTAAMESVSHICIIPIQDWLELGKEARINTPGKSEGNWVFRLRKRMLSNKLSERILLLTKGSGRAWK